MTVSDANPFHVTTAGSLACGAPLSMSLTLATSQGRYRVPVSIATGKAGTAESTNATDLPKAIPEERERHRDQLIRDRRRQWDDRRRGRAIAESRTPGWGTCRSS